MKKLLAILTLLFCTWELSLAQNPSEGIIEKGDTLTIQATFNGNPLNALNQWILWDLNGSINNPPKHTVYKLLLNKVYPITAVVNYKGRLTLVADKPSLNNKPPQVGPAEDASGKGPGQVMFLITGPITFKNIAFTDLSFTSNTNSTTQTVAQTQGDNLSSYIDGCYYENINRFAIQVGSGLWNKVYVTNSFYRNGGDESGNDGRGHFFSSNGQPLDTVVFRNNTYINTPGLLINIAKDMVRYLELNHNTCINTIKRTVNIANYIEAHIKNNIFYNTIAQGQLKSDIAGSISGCRDLQPVGIVDADTLLGNTITDATWYTKEKDRIFEVANNWYGWTDNVINYINIDTASVQTPWMNTRTVGMFGNKTLWPKFTETKTYSRGVNGLPDFVTPIVGTDSMIAFINNVIRLKGKSPLRWYWEPAGAKVPNNDIEWPPIEDLRIKNAALIGDDGKPIGDLNWYSNYAERWDMTGWGRTTAVEENDYSIPDVFSLEQNFPNPFNPETMIKYNLTRTGNVTLTIFNVLGEKITTLVRDIQDAGVHSVRWDGRNSAGQTLGSGLYFYILRMDAQVITKKMMLLK